jgi:hypothetical protein
MNARVTVLREVTGDDAVADPESDAPRETDSIGAFEAEVLVLEQPVMELLARQSVQPDAAVRIDTIDAIWLGEATECSARGDSFAIRIRLRHVLRDFETLARLAERFGTAAAKGIPVQI